MRNSVFASNHLINLYHELKQKKAMWWNNITSSVYYEERWLGQTPLVEW